MSVFHNNALIGAGGGTGAAAAEAVVATKSLRFNAGDSAYLSRTPSSAGNRRTFTFSCWFKLVETSGTRRYLFSAASANTGSPYNWILGFAVLDGQLCYTNAANDIYKTDAILRDFGAWYHCVFAVDTTQATASDRVKIYLNGVLMDITDQNHGGADPPSQNTEYAINNTTAHAVGAVWNHQNTDLSGYFNGYIADAYLIDGSALTPSSFGAYDDNGVWQAAAYSGTYGTNGFHLLDFENESTLGHDSSGNNNDFTAVNFLESSGQHINAVSGTARSGFPFANMFDGRLDHGALPAASTSYTFTPTTSIPFSTLHVYAYKDSSPGTLKINGTDVTSQVPNHNGIGPNQRTQITGISSPLTSIQNISLGNLANVVFAARP